MSSNSPSNSRTNAPSNTPNNAATTTTSTTTTTTSTLTTGNKNVDTFLVNTCTKAKTFFAGNNALKKIELDCGDMKKVFMYTGVTIIGIIVLIMILQSVLGGSEPSHSGQPIIINMPAPGK